MQAVIDKIIKAKSVAIFPHVNEDPDALGSCFAFAAMLRKMNKKATIYVSGKIEKRLSFIGTDYVIYHDGIEHDHDLCACLDCGDIERISNRRAMFDEIANSVNIDHHFTNTRFADANYVDGNASATGEILFELFSRMGLKPDDDIAKSLYIAISSDTGCYKYSNVTPKTMRTAASLLEYDFDHAEIARLLFDCESINAVKLRAEVMSSVKQYEDGMITLVITDEKIGSKYGLEKQDIPNLVDIPRRIEGCEIAVCLKRVDDGFRLNLRSNGDADVAEVAVEFGGGGHVRAAGATVLIKDADAAEKAVVDACRRALNKIK